MLSQDWQALPLPIENLPLPKQLNENGSGYSKHAPTDGNTISIILQPVVHGPPGQRR
jgi:hypothetical protein